MIYNFPYIFSDWMWFFYMFLFGTADILKAIIAYFCDYSDFFLFLIINNKTFCLEVIFILNLPISSNFKLFEVSVTEMFHFVLHIFIYFWFVTK